MYYHKLAAQQRGFLLRSQLTEKDIREARETGFIVEGDPPHSEHIFYTKLIGAHILMTIIGYGS